MRYFIDTEFLQHDRRIDLISIGVVAEDGRELYLQCSEFDPKQASDFVQKQVLPHIQFCLRALGTMQLTPEKELAQQLKAHRKGQCVDQQRGLLHHCPWRTREQIKHELFSFIGDETPEFWGDFCAYDFVVISQLFGEFERWPARWPFYFNDIEQLVSTITDAMGRENLPASWQSEISELDKPHHAFSDALIIKRTHEVLTHYSRGCAS